MTPEEKLLHAIFGRAGEDVKNDSLEVPSGIEGIVINTQRFSRRMSLSDDERNQFEKELKEAEDEGNALVVERFKAMIEQMEAESGSTLTDEDGTPLAKDQDDKFIVEKAAQFRVETVTAGLRSEDKKKQCRGGFQNVLA